MEVNRETTWNSVTTVSNEQTTSQALAESESQSTALHLFSRTRSFHRLTFIRPDMTVKLQRAD